MIYLLIKSRNHELSSTSHTRHRKTSLNALNMKQSKLTTKFLMSQTFSGGSNQHVPQAFTLEVSLTHKFYTRSKALHNLPQALNKPTLVTLTPAIQQTHNTISNTPKTKDSKLASHSNGESLNRIMSLHEWWEDELISNEGSTNDGTAMPEKGGRHKQGQKSGLESSGRPTIGTNLPKLDHRRYITGMPR